MKASDIEFIRNLAKQYRERDEEVSTVFGLPRGICISIARTTEVDLSDDTCRLLLNAINELPDHGDHENFKFTRNSDFGFDDRADWLEDFADAHGGEQPQTVKEPDNPPEPKSPWGDPWGAQ